MKKVIEIEVRPTIWFYCLNCGEKWIPRAKTRELTDSSVRCKNCKIVSDFKEKDKAEALKKVNATTSEQLLLNRD